MHYAILGALTVFNVHWYKYQQTSNLTNCHSHWLPQGTRAMHLLGTKQGYNIQCCKLFTAHFASEQRVLLQHYRLHQRKRHQRPNGLIQPYMAELHVLAKSCRFNTQYKWPLNLPIKGQCGCWFSFHSSRSQPNSTALIYRVFKRPWGVA